MTDTYTRLDNLREWLGQVGTLLLLDVLIAVMEELDSRFIGHAKPLAELRARAAELKDHIRAARAAP